MTLDHAPRIPSQPELSSEPENTQDACFLENKETMRPGLSCRNVRRDSMKAISALKLGEDEQKNYEDSVQENTDSAVKELEDMLKVKQEELTTM